jgi:hypothetical protein
MSVGRARDQHGIDAARRHRGVQIDHLRPELLRQRFGGPRIGIGNVRETRLRMARDVACMNAAITSVFLCLPSRARS